MIELIILIVIVGVVLYLINTYVPMQPPWKTILNIVVILLFLLWLLRAFGYTRLRF